MNSVRIKRQLWLSVDRKQVLCLIMQNGSYCKIGYSFGPLSDRSPWEKQTERIRKCQYQRYSSCAQCECLNKSCIPVSLNDSHRALLFLPGAPLWWCWRPPLLHTRKQNTDLRKWGGGRDLSTFEFRHNVSFESLHLLLLFHMGLWYPNTSWKLRRMISGLGLEFWSPGFLRKTSLFCDTVWVYLKQMLLLNLGEFAPLDWRTLYLRERKSGVIPLSMSWKKGY